VQLDRIEIKLRRRSPWEAIDLGLAMLRRWRGPVYRLWLAIVLPAAIGILAVFWTRPQLGMFIVWWMKPIADRLLLKLFSESIFGEPPTLREVWRSIPALLRHTGLLSRLTLRRFTPYRSFELPMLQLEKQRGKALALRNRTLNRKVAGHAFWLMFVCFHLVVIFEFGLTLFADLLIPGDASSGFSLYDLLFEEPDLIGMHLFNAAWLIAESIVEPFYVAAGLSLYLNRRSELEGWDIEVAFRQMAESHAGTAAPVRPPKRGGIGLTVAAVLLGAQIFLAVPDALAAPEGETADAATVAGEASRAVREVLSDPVFGGDVEEMRWRPRAKKNTDEKPERSGKPSWWAKFEDIVNWLAWGARGALYVLMAAALAALLVILYRYSGRFLPLMPPSRRAARAPETLFGLDLRPASLPADIPAAAWAEAEAGRMAAALSLLYRGALVALIEGYRVSFRDGDTEDVCLRRAAGRAEEAVLAYFSVLLGAWKASAYADSPPSLAGVRVLCQGWTEHFAGRGGAV
jgi:hypothetical protein